MYLSDKHKYETQHRLKRNKLRGTTEYFLKHLDALDEKGRKKLLGLLWWAVRKKDFERLKRREPSKLRLSWQGRSHAMYWQARETIWPEVVKQQMWWLPFFETYMDLEWFEGHVAWKRKVNEFRELYVKNYGVPL